MWTRRQHQRERRRAVAWSATRRVGASASAVVLGRDRARVWAFIRPAESALLIEPDVVEAFTVPGTGPGIGEQQRFVRVVEGREQTHTTSLVGLEEGVFADLLFSGFSYPAGAREALEPADGGVLFTVTSWCDLPAESRRDDIRTIERSFGEQAARYVMRVKTLVESGVADAWPPPVG